MPFVFRDLDGETRRLMLEEIAAAIREGNLYYSKRFNQAGTDAWPSLLSEAAENHDEHWLAYQLESQGHFKGMEGSATPSGGYTIKHVPHTAAETMAEGQFNRYYILAVCGRATAGDTPHVVVYRAKAVAAPRPESEALVGQHLEPSALANEIRPVGSSLGHALLKPNSGLSVSL